MQSLFLAPHRPFFVLSALWAALGGIGWLLALRGVATDYGQMAVLHPPLLVLGFGGAASAGFLLTSLPGWTRCAPIHGWLLAGLVLAWAVGQAVIGLGVGAVVPWPGRVLVLAFPLALALVMAERLLAARVYRRLWSLLVPTGLGGVALAYLGWPQAVAGWQGLHPQAPVLIYTLLISVVGGRAIIGFGRNFLLRSGRGAVPTAAGWEELASLALLAGGLLAYTTSDGVSGAIGLGLAAVGQVWRLRHWWLAPIWREPLLVALLAGFIWLPVGLGLLAWVRLDPAAVITGKDTLHALSMGMMGGMVAAMAGRAAARRVGGALVARPGLLLACGLIWLAAGLRILAPLWPDAAMNLTSLAALLWTAGWAVWLLAFLPALRGPVLRPVLSGSRVTPPPGGNG